MKTIASISQTSLYRAGGVCRRASLVPRLSRTAEHVAKKRNAAFFHSLRRSERYEM